ncbi:outer membrane beta-barrel protein [Pseudomonadota bacterium]
MKVTKTIALAGFVGALSISSASAKTQGHYAGIDLINTNFETYDAIGEKKHDNDYGVGINYKYAFNINNFFVAPVLFYDNSNTQTKYSTSFMGGAAVVESSGRLRHRYGIRSDFGYDITDKFAVYGMFGYAELRIRRSGDNIKEESLLYGLGTKYSITKRLDVSTSYETSTYANKRDNRLKKFFMDVDVIRLGMSYKF